MASRQAGWTIELAPDVWRIVSPSGADAEPPQTFPPEELTAQAEPIRTALAEAGWRGAPLVLALSDGWLLAATIPVASPQLLRKRQAMRYELETAIPWTAEDYVCDYAAHRDAACMIAVQISPLREFLAALDEQDAGPVVVAPGALLALQAVQGQRNVPADGQFVWRRDDERASWFSLRDGRLWAWRELATAELRPLATEAIAVALADGSATECASVGLSEAEQAALVAAGWAVTPLDDLDWDAALQSTAAALATGEAEPMVNLRRDELAGRRAFDALRRETRGLVAAALLTVAAVCGALWLRGDAYQEATAVVQQDLVNLFEETFPEEPVPERGLAAKFRNAHRELQATRGGASLPERADSDVLLQRVLDALPTELRYRVPEIRVTGTSVYLAGEVRSNADADVLAAALRSGGGDVAPPRLQRLPDKGFALRLTAEFGGEEDRE